MVLDMQVSLNIFTQFFTEYILMSTSISVSFNRVESLRYTAYIQDCMKVLEDSREYESDITLLYLVRVQRLTERIFELYSNDKAVEDIPGLPSAPISAYIAAFQNEIDNMRANLPPKLQNDSMLPSSIFNPESGNCVINILTISSDIPRIS